ncbi:hypothetical protein NMY22_g4437 [Coprinellus aureogranulatus]|nr:hypothetical protein NMY22_g4437 [Coprinellus aureogranulatus]
MGSPGESQAELDARIYALEVELAHLKQRRNTLSAISRLPPEIYSKIFVSSIPGTGNEDPTERILIQAMSVSHVSHTWRSIAVACPELWGILHVNLRTSAEILNLTLERSQHAPIYLDIDVYASSQGPSEAVISALSNMARAGSSRLREMALHVREDSLRMLFSGMTVTFNRLVSLKLAVNYERDYDKLEALNQCSFPSLQQLDVDCHIPAGHALLQSSRLTDVRIFSLTPTTTTFIDLLTLMKRSNNLRRFHVSRFHHPIVAPTFDFSSANAGS